MGFRSRALFLPLVPMEIAYMLLDLTDIGLAPYAPAKKVDVASTVVTEPLAPSRSNPESISSRSCSVPQDWPNRKLAKC